MEARKLVLKSLFHGRNEDSDIENGLVERGRRKSGTNRK